MLGIIAKKIGMTQIFDEAGLAVPVTVLEVLENVVTQKKTQSTKDAYNALQIGAMEEKVEHRLSKAEIGHCRKKNLSVFRVLKEFRVPEETLEAYQVGDVLDPLQVLGEAGSSIDLRGRPIGRGTSGRIKRWNQHRRSMTHGTKHHRQIGSAGPGTTPGRVFKGKKMPGRDKNAVTIARATLVKYHPEHKMLLVRGAVPGYRGGIVYLSPSKPKQGWNRCAFALGRHQRRAA